MSLRVVRAEGESAREDAFDVRERVFVEEQGVSADLEYDDHDDPGSPTAHFVAYDGDCPVGAARLREYEDDADAGKVERVAVLAAERERGVGRALMDAVHEAARERGYAELRLHAQTRVRGFYESLGYEAFGGEFEEAGIPHVAMRRALQ